MRIKKLINRTIDATQVLNTMKSLSKNFFSTKHIILAVAAVCLIAAGIYSLTFPGKNTAKEVLEKEKTKYFHIGVLAPLEGPLAAYGRSIERGAKTAALALNKNGGILGKKVKLHVIDTRSRAALAGEFAEELIERLDVPLLLGTASDEESLAVIQAASATTTPFFYVANGTVKTCSNTDSKKPSDFVWGTGLTEHMRVEPFLVYLADRFRLPKSPFRIYYFGTDDPQSNSNIKFVRTVAESLDFPTVAHMSIDERIRDYYQRIRKIFKERSDLLFVSTSPKATLPFMTQSKKLGLQAEMKLAGLDMFEEERLASIQGLADGVYTVTRYTHLLDNEENRAFIKLWQELYPQHRPTALAVAGAYSSLLIAAEAFNKAGSTEPEKFKEAMSNIELSLPQGRVIVDASNHLLIQPLYAAMIIQNQLKVEEYLGDVSHPLLDRCVIEQIEPEAVE